MGIHSVTKSPRRPPSALAARAPDALAASPFSVAMSEALELAPDALDLRSFDPTSRLPELRARLAEVVVAATQDAMRQPYQPDPRGRIEARQAIAAWTGAREGRDLSPDQVILTASTSEAYSLITRTACAPGEAVAIPTPGYPLFEHLLRLDGAVARPYRYSYEGGTSAPWALDAASLRAACAPGTRALITVQPNNPTGHTLTAEVAALKAELARSSGLVWAVDEVFLPYAQRPDVHLPGVLSWLGALSPAARPLTLALSGLSKLATLPGVKLGWIILDGSPDAVAEAAAHLSFANDQALSASTAAQLTAARLLGTDEGLSLLKDLHAALLGCLHRNRAALEALCQRHPALTLIETPGGWSATLRLPRVMDDDAWALHLARRAGVRTQPGFLYDLDAHLGAALVLSLLTPPEVWDAGLERLAALLP